jgi:single-strand DNA-binding protein
VLSINKIMLTGRLTRDPETRFLPSGQPVTKVSFAVNRRYQDRGGEWRDETFYMDAEIFGKQAEYLAERARKGVPVYVEGRLKQDSWERDGQRQTKFSIVADRISVFEVPTRGGSGMIEDGGSYDSGSAPARRPAQSQSPSREREAHPVDSMPFDPTDDNIPF